MKKSLGTVVAMTMEAILIGTFITAKYATAGETGRDGRFIAYDNEIVLDTQTNLMWAVDCTPAIRQIGLGQLGRGSGF